jgi:phosphomethylpyrimidine synthase
MKITQEVREFAASHAANSDLLGADRNPGPREFAAKQNAPVETFVAADEAEAGMAAMSQVFKDTGSELYMGAGGREHD